MPSRFDVLRHFLRIEATRGEYADRNEELLAWSRLPDEELNLAAKRFAEERGDVCPVFVYTVGVGADDRHARVAGWTRDQVPSSEIYTSGINNRTAADLSAVSWNMSAFALKYAPHHEEFRGGNRAELTGEARVLIVVRQHEAGRVGTLELLDGAHRLVAMIRSGAKTVEAYVAAMKS